MFNEMPVENVVVDFPAGLSHVQSFHDFTARIILDERGRRALAKTERC